jgi:hypothetical protein
MYLSSFGTSVPVRQKFLEINLSFERLRVLGSKSSVKNFAVVSAVTVFG